MATMRWAGLLGVGLVLVALAGPASAEVGCFEVPAMPSSGESNVCFLDGRPAAYPDATYVAYMFASAALYPYVENGEDYADLFLGYRVVQDDYAYDDGATTIDRTSTTIGAYQAYDGSAAGQAGDEYAYLEVGTYEYATQGPWGDYGWTAFYVNGGVFLNLPGARDTYAYGYYEQFDWSNQGCEEVLGLEVYREGDYEIVEPVSQPCLVELPQVPTLPAL